MDAGYDVDGHLRAKKTGVRDIPSGKHRKKLWKITIFNSYVKLPEGTYFDFLDL